MNYKNFKKYKVFLASSSPRRKKILQDAGLKFKVVKNNLNEEFLKRKFKRFTPKKFVKLLSLAKILTVYSDIPKNGFVIGFDTIVVCNNKIIDKPKNKQDALKKILFLSDKTHKVYTAFTILNLRMNKILNNLKEKNKSFYEYVLRIYDLNLLTIGVDCTLVRMKKITSLEAKKYVLSGEPFGKAGAYAIQGKGNKLVKSIKGDFLNVVGLPKDKFILMFKKEISKKNLM